MKKKIVTTTMALAVVASLPHTVLAAGFGTGIKVSTLGPGVEIEGRMNDNLGLRANANYLPFSVSVTADDVDYDADFSWKSGGAMVDFYPFSGIFRITGGLFYNGNDVDLSATPSSNVTVGDSTYTPAQIGSIDGSLDFNTIAPYAGLGWSGGKAASGNWTVSFDVGVLFQGSPSVDELTASGDLAGNAAFIADLEKEKAEIEDEMEPFQYYPVLALTVSYFW